jgi:hypothetical protein
MPLRLGIAVSKRAASGSVALSIASTTRDEYTTGDAGRRMKVTACNGEVAGSNPAGDASCRSSVVEHHKRLQATHACIAFFFCCSRDSGIGRAGRSARVILIRRSRVRVPSAAQAAVAQSGRASYILNDHMSARPPQHIYSANAGSAAGRQKRVIVAERVRLPHDINRCRDPFSTPMSAVISEGEAPW